MERFCVVLVVVRQRASHARTTHLLLTAYNSDENGDEFVMRFVLFVRKCTVE